MEFFKEYKTKSNDEILNTMRVLKEECDEIVYPIAVGGKGVRTRWIYFKNLRRLWYFKDGEQPRYIIDLDYNGVVSLCLPADFVPINAIPSESGKWKGERG